jgi:hypothetical protein
MQGRSKTKTGKIMLLLTKLKKGDTFYTDIADKNVQAYASNYDVKCSTEVCIILTNIKTKMPQAKKITKVTIV